ncbi:MAG TPA: tetratricopeptide repeat protein [Planctomycetaceae bacterium]|nr:tetratricopeptide repeat protein [Planctomycetaceae bacterium]
MTRLRNAFLVLIAGELVAFSVFALRVANRPQPPAPDFNRIAPSTAADLNRLRRATWTDSPRSWSELGHAFLAHGYFVEAEACLHRASTLAPRDFASRFARAYSLERLGRNDAARQQFEEAAGMGNEQEASNCWYHIGQCCLRDERPEEAVAAFDRIRNLPLPDFWRARTLIEMGRAADAQPIVAQLLEGYPDSLELQMLAVRRERAAGRDAAADLRAERAERASAKFSLFDHAVFLNPIRQRYGQNAELNRIDTELDAGRLAEALRDLERIADELAPDRQLEAFPKAVHLELQMKRPQAALALLQKLEAQGPLTPRALHLLGDTYAMLDQPHQAREAWERANRHRPRVETHEALAEAYAKQGDPGAAQRERGLAQRLAGITAYHENRLSEAREHLEQASKMLPQDARVHFYLGEILGDIGQRSAAEKEYRRCLELDPDFGRALARITPDAEHP